MDKEHLEKLREEMIEYIRTAPREELQASVDEFNKRMGLCKNEKEDTQGCNNCYYGYVVCNKEDSIFYNQPIEKIRQDIQHCKHYAAYEGDG